MRTARIEARIAPDVWRSSNGPPRFRGAVSAISLSQRHRKLHSGQSAEVLRRPREAQECERFVEKEFSSTASLIVFLALFFSNFAVSWIAVILAMDGSLKNAQGAQEQLDIEKAERAGIASRAANAIAARAARTAGAVPNARPAI